MLKRCALALAAATLALSGCDTNDGNDPTIGTTVYVTDGASLYTFTPNKVLEIDEKAFVGLPSSTLIVALDVNPRGGGLTGLASDGTSYKIDVSNGQLTAAGKDASASLANKAVEIDYNPTVANQQVYRVTSSTGDNYRQNDTTGARVGTDTAFAYKTGDANAGKSVVVSGIAYTNSQLNTGVPASTTVFAIDSQNDVLARLGGSPADGAACPNTTNPNCGQLTTIGSLGVDVGGFIGFDIAGAGTAYATALKDGTYNLYTVNLTTGALGFVTGLNPKITPVRAFAVKQS